jgi:hypothetical protein
MVNGYVALDAMLGEQSRTRELVCIDDPNVVWTQWARFVAWRASARLYQLVETPAFGIRPYEAISLLEHAVEDVQRALDDTREGEVPIKHFGG